MEAVGGTIDRGHEATKEILDKNIMEEKELLTNVELDCLADQVDQELKELSTDPTRGFQKSSSGKKILAVPEKQRVAIEKATGESADSFWQKYKQAARKDLCHKDGLLYEQWHKWRDLPSKDAVKVSLGLVAGLGISGTALPVVTVAASVILLNIVLNIGVNAICEDEKKEENKEAK
jgi:hypothetical protein